MREYFEAEMRLLREFAAEFAKTYPQQASKLQINSSQDSDPYIERLLEGTAYLTAQIKQRIDDDLPDICETLLEHLSPDMLRPFPAATIIQFQPKPGQLQKTYELPQGTPLQSKNSYYFRTTAALKIHPLQLLKSTFEENVSGTKIKIFFQSTTQNYWQDLQVLPLYLHADTGTALNLYYILTHKVTAVRILYPELTHSSAYELGKQEVIMPQAFSAEQMLLPLSAKTFLGFSLLKEYFCFREKHLFIKLCGIDGKKIPASCRQWVIEIETSGKLSDYNTIPADVFRLHCVPAINLFTKSSEPIILNQQRVEYPISCDLNETEQAIFSVDSVEGIDNSGKRKKYSAMSSFLHRQSSEKDFYHIHFRSLGSLYPVPFLTLQQTNNLRIETLSCQITAMQGHQPRAVLQENTINVPGSGFPTFLEFQNITRPSPMYMSAQKPHYRWTLIAHLSLNYTSFTHIEALQKLLMQYEWTGRQENVRKIAGLQVLQVQPLYQFHHGVLRHGLEFNITCLEEYFLSIADIYLFTSVLHEFFTLYIPINNFIITRVNTLPSQQEFIWQTLTGKRSLL